MTKSTKLRVMIYSIDSQSVIDRIPHRRDYVRWRGRLSDPEYDAIIDDLTNKIADTEVRTSSWIPGNDWTNTVYDPIYSKACNNDYDQAALFFGLLVWDAFSQHPDYWAFGRYELNKIPIKGLTYFRIAPRV